MTPLTASQQVVHASSIRYRLLRRSAAPHSHGPSRSHTTQHRSQRYIEEAPHRRVCVRRSSPPPAAARRCSTRSACCQRGTAAAWTTTATSRHHGSNQERLGRGGLAVLSLWATLRRAGHGGADHPYCARSTWRASTEIVRCRRRPAGRRRPPNAPKALDGRASTPSGSRRARRGAARRTAGRRWSCFSSTAIHGSWCRTRHLT